MKKRVLTIFLILLATIASALSVFASCGGQYQISFMVEDKVYTTVDTGGYEVVAMPQNPQKEDYTFDGWYLDEGSWQTPFTANSLLDAPLSSDMKVYAKFTKTHTHSYAKTTIEPTCTKKGKIVYACVCGDEYFEEIPATNEHTWDSGKVTAEPTCTEKGVKAFTCTVCKTATYTELIDEEPHAYAKDWSTSETHHWYECKCGDKAEENKHTPSAPATATTPQTCTICGFVIQEETGILFNTLTVDGTKVYGKVSNSTEEFSFIDEILVVGKAKFVLATDKNGYQQLNEKTISLQVGDNVVYVIETVNDEPTVVYTVTLRRRPTYEVTFNANGGTSVEKQVVEEDYFVAVPKTERAGYTFASWDYDFTTPITQTTQITASWQANTDTPYKVEYYLQNLEDDEYTLDHTDSLSGTTDTTATAQIKDFEHFTYNASASRVNGNINGDGSRILSVYYTRDSYGIATDINNTKAGTATGSGTYLYGKQITLTIATSVGYTFLGWYDGETLVCKTEDFTFCVVKPITYMASWQANTDTPYKVEYYLQNLEDDEYTLDHTDSLSGTTDTTATAQIKTFEHFTYNASASAVSENIDGDGSRVLSVYYSRNTYTLSVNNYSAGDITINGKHKYGKAISATVTPPNLGYDFIGWFSGEILLSSDSTYTFMVTQNVTAKYEAKAEMAIFKFASTLTDCYIGGIKDTTVTEIVVPDYVTRIGQKAFFGCSSLTEIVIPDSVTEIGTAFTDCENLQEITLPFVGESAGITGYKSVFGYIFGCYLESYTYHYNIPSSLKKVTFTGDNLPESAFAGCSSLTQVVLAEGLTEIPSSAFSGCTGITSIDLPKSVTKISDYAFSGTGITSIDLPEGLTEIPTGAFSGCIHLVKFRIGETVSSIGERAFRNCYKLVEVINESAHITVEKGASNNGQVGYNALSVANCDSSYESKVVDDGGYLVYLDGEDKILLGYNGYETDLVLPNYITQIYEYAFYRRANLTNVIISDGVTRIGYAAFYNSGLTSVSIPDSIEWMGVNAFGECSSLDYLEESGLQYLGNENNPYLCLMVNTYSDAAKRGQYNVINATIHGDCKIINHDAFYGCWNLQNIIIPSKVTQIGRYAFYGCKKITSVVIPDTVIQIGNYAFANCASLTELVIGNSVKQISAHAFDGCNGISKVSIPKSVERIREYAFESKSMLIIMNEPVPQVDEYAFCCLYLTVCYTGTQETWVGFRIFYEDTFLEPYVYYYVENEQDVPNDYGHYWHYGENGSPVAW